MSTHYKSGLVVLVMALAFFVLARPLFRQFMSDADFAVRRNAWLALNAIAFIAPSFWIYVAVASWVLLRAASRDSNPAALYMFLLLAMAPVGLPLPTFGIINTLFPLDHLRLLSLALLIPVIIQSHRLRQRNGALHSIDKHAFSGVRVIDLMVVGYCVLQVVLLLPYSSLTVTLRRVVLLAMDILIPYFAISRAVRDRPVVSEALAAFSLSMMVLAPMALLEMYWRLMLYGGLQEVWATKPIYFQLLRAGLLRAQVTSGQSIVLGYCMAIALILWLAQLHRVQSAAWRWGGSLLLTAALIASFSRGPWVGAVAGVLAMLALGPMGAKRLAKVAMLAFAFACAVIVSPLGESVISWLPFVGEQDEGTVVYRQRLLEISLQLIANDPLTGNPFFIQYMEELRQGQGIIDLVNGIVTIALSFGVIGLGTFLAAKFIVLWKCFVLRRHAAPEVQWSAAGIGACIVASLVILFTVASFLSIPYLFWGLAALGTLLSVEARLHSYQPQEAVVDEISDDSDRREASRQSWRRPRMRPAGGTRSP